MRYDFDVIVIGGGVMGTAAARALAERGRSTLLLERDAMGNDAGSSSGHTRIFRLAYDHPDYVRLARLALDAWRELESRAGERLLHTTGGVDVGEASLACADAMAAAGVPFERTTPDAVAERWPALRFDPGETLLVQDDAGVCLVKETIAAQARLAREAGATLLEHTAAASLHVTGHGAEVGTSAEGSHAAHVLVLAAGAWNGPLLAEAGLPLSLRPTFEQPAHFTLPEPMALPTVVDRSLGAEAPRYAVPDPRDRRAVKVGTHLGRTPIDPDELARTRDEERFASDVEFARRRFAGAEPTGDADACIYTMAPDEDFVLDRRGDVVVCSPCSGHGFKFAPLIGALVADLADARPAPVRLERFRSSRASVSG
ncbi:MAG: FAD-dependent oxidoreductase [Actinomycetota bacterium]